MNELIKTDDLSDISFSVSGYESEFAALAHASNDIAKDLSGCTGKYGKRLPQWALCVRHGPKQSKEQMLHQLGVGF